MREVIKFQTPYNYKYIAINRSTVCLS